MDVDTRTRELGRLIRDARQHILHWSQNSLGRRSHVTQTAVSAWELGLARPLPKHAQALRECFTKYAHCTIPGLSFFEQGGALRSVREMHLIEILITVFLEHKDIFRFHDKQTLALYAREMAPQILAAYNRKHDSDN